jgi:hypothetical protein
MLRLQDAMPGILASAVTYSMLKKTTFASTRRHERPAKPEKYGNDERRGYPQYRFSSVTIIV